MTTYKSPDCPPCVPPSPSPLTRRREPVSTPAGILISSVFSFSMRPAPLAFFTRIFDDLPFPAAVGAGSHHAEKSLLIANLPASLAGHAGFRRGSLFRSFAFAFVAFFETRNVQLFFFSGRRFFKRDFQIVAQIRAALRRRAPSAPPPAPPNISPKPNRSKISSIFEKPGTGAAESRARADALMPETVVSRAFLRVGQNRISFRRFLKFFFRRVVVRDFCPDDAESPVCGRPL